MIRVLHSVHTYLNLSENWIYPQIRRVPGTEPGVVCASLANQAAFPLDSAPIVFDPPAPPRWRHKFGMPTRDHAAIRAVPDETVKRIRSWRPEVIHAHFGSRAWEMLNWKYSLNLPMVTSFYGYDAWRLPASEPVWRRRYPELFEQCEAFLVEGPAMRRRLEELGCPPAKVRIQRIGVDLTALPFHPRSFADGLKVVMVGRFVEKKGFVDGLRACALARSRGAKISVTVVGAPGENDPPGVEIQRDLHALADGADLSGNVRFTGFLSLEQTRATLASHNVFLCPSRRAANGDAEGGSPVALTEAMAMGLLCIGTRHCDIPEIIVDGETGYICNEGDFDALAGILHDAKQIPIDAITAAARRHIQTEYSLRNQLGTLEQVYQSLARKH